MSVSDEGVGATTTGGAPAAQPRCRTEIMVVALAAVAVGLVLRFVTRSALWLDEALSANIAQVPLGELTEALRHDGHPPLYYVLLHAWSAVFGTGDVAVRALSGVLGVATLPLAWWYGRRRGGPTLAWVLLGLVAVSPFALRYATETRMYALVILLVFAGALLLDEVLRRGHDDLARLAGLAVVGAALLYTHYWSLWLLGAVGLLMVWRMWRSPEPSARRRAWRVLGALAVAGVLFVPWLPSMLYQSAHTGTPWADPQRPTTVLGDTFGDFTGFGFSDSRLFAIVLVLAAVLGLFGRAVDARHIQLDLRTVPQFRSEAIVTGVTLAIAAVVSYVTWSAYATRYAAVFFPLVMTVVAGGLLRFVGRWVQFGAFVALVGMLSVGALYNVHDQRTQLRQISEAVAAEAGPGDLVVYCPDQLGPAGSREMPADVEQVVYPTFDGPRIVDWRDYEERNTEADPQAFAERALAEAGPDHSIFVVWNGSYRTFEGQCEALVSALSASRPSQELVADGGGTFYEHATLTWLPPTS